MIFRVNALENAQQIFYASISRYYSDIFPFNPAQLSFVERQLFSLQNKSLLDIGCATGELSFQLARRDANVTGIDLSTGLLQQALARDALPNLVFKEGNMLNLKSDFQQAQFDSVICFGNTLVHLDSLEIVKKMLEGVRFVLKPGGKFLLQILNYDYILENQVNTLPQIETDKLIFIRNYEFVEGAEHVQFKTRLFLKNEGIQIQNKTKLLALRSRQLQAALKESGFSKISFYSGFNEDAFGGSHLPLVASCR